MYQAKRKGKGKLFFMEEITSIDSGQRAMTTTRSMTTTDAAV
jgi:hypothetical protein